MPFLSELARRKKIRFFIEPLPKDVRILEVGCGSGSLASYLRAHGWLNYVGLDLRPPADIVGEVREWRSLGLKPESFDVLIAFEVVEHLDGWAAFHALLKPGGKLLVTTPRPDRDWVMRLLETLGLNQPRTSPHDHLVDLNRVSGFSGKQVRIVAGLSQWAVFVK